MELKNWTGSSRAGTVGSTCTADPTRPNPTLLVHDKDRNSIFELWPNMIRAGPRDDDSSKEIVSLPKGR
jgi:hypothetical protein